MTRDHWVEVDLGDDAPREGPVWLLAHGWIHPTDSSINVAIEQGKHDRPQALVLEVPDGKGGWKVGRPALGFPAGKNKTILVRLDGITGQGVSAALPPAHQHGDLLGRPAVCRGLDAELARPTLAASRTRPTCASAASCDMTQADTSSPELPHYDQVICQAQHWRDLIGYYTRFGDVRELLARVDDRYVIMNAGDEIALRFPAPAEPPPGWKRDFVWVCDGWAKDGDLNTRFSKTVLPLPAHDLTSLRRRRPAGWRTTRSIGAFPKTGRSITPAT